MARQPTSAMRAWFDEARATPIRDVLTARQIRLRGGGVEKAGPCPRCGGRDRFAVNLRKNIFFCRQGCASGSPIDLVLFLDGGSERAAAEALTGRPPPDGASEALSPEEIAAAEAARATARAQAEAAAAQWSERERAKLRRWWDRAQPAPGTPVEAYLRLRGLSLPRGASLRYRAKHELLHERELVDADGRPLLDAAGRPRRERFVAHTGPAMLAAIAGPDGHFAALHMTWIDLARPDGKAVVACPYTGEILPAKKVRGSKTAGSIPLNRIEAEPRRLILGEGIETTLAVREALIREGADLSRTLFRSAVDLGNLGGKHLATVKHPSETYLDRAGRTRARLIPGPVPDLTAPAIAIPEGVTEVVTLGDGDSEVVITRHAHARAAARWTTPTCRVRAVFADPGTDFNTMLRAP